MGVRRKQGYHLGVPRVDAALRSKQRARVAGRPRHAHRGRERARNPGAHTDPPPPARRGSRRRRALRLRRAVRRLGRP
eukprot:1065678-Pleurochrysis_carterae.AAC.1